MHPKLQDWLLNRNSERNDLAKAIETPVFVESITLALEILLQETEYTGDKLIEVNALRHAEQCGANKLVKLINQLARPSKELLEAAQPPKKAPEAWGYLKSEKPKSTVV